MRFAAGAPTPAILQSKEGRSVPFQWISSEPSRVRAVAHFGEPGVHLCRAAVEIRRALEGGLRRRVRFIARTVLFVLEM